MPRGRPLKALEVSRGAREELRSLVRSRSLPAGLARRAEIVLLCADGLDNKAVAERVRTTLRTPYGPAANAPHREAEHTTVPDHTAADRFATRPCPPGGVHIRPAS